MIRENKIHFESLSANKFNVKELFTSQGMEQYFNLLDEPIYAHLVQEFSMKAWVLDRKYVTAQEEEMVNKHPKLEGKSRAEMGLPPFLEPEIHSNIGGLKIKILKGHFAALLRITSSGKQLKNYEKDGIRTHKKALEKVIEKPSIFSKDGKELEKKGITSDNPVKINIVYPRLLSALFERTGLIELIKPFYLTLGVSEEIEVFDPHSLKNMKFISTVAPTPPPASEVVYQDTNILIPLSAVPDDPQMKNVPKRKRSKSTKKQSKPSTKKRITQPSEKLSEDTTPEANTQTQPTNVVRDSETESDDNQTLAAGILRKRSAVSPTKSSSTSPIAKKPCTSRRLYKPLNSPSQSPPPSGTQLQIQPHSPQIQTSQQHMTVTLQHTPLSTPQKSLSLSPNHIIETASLSTPTHNMAPVVSTSTPPVIHLSVTSLLESLQRDLPHLAYLRDEAVIHRDDLFDEFHKIQDYFNASMKTLAVQYNELSTYFMEFIISCQQQQYAEAEQTQLFAEEQLQLVHVAQLAEAEAIKWLDEEHEQRQIFEGDHQLVIEAVRTTKNQAAQWFAKRELFEEDHQRVIDVANSDENEAHQWFEGEDTRMATEGSQPLFQISAGPSDAAIEARLTAEEEKQREMQLTLTSLVDSQAEIKP
ncbi:hypothetical protein TSUD_365810 [Trifolium subterraneum]|uniref:Uncharacterized protein n=1 Tax=Trifolium subterraneum TaxID=3900 RepID=A0A2Z6NIJ9_TRISU|nr:hypothetical protein TSUD_365810 [Trifolium subterraneum]